MCMNIEIASFILEICIVPEPATTSGTGLLDRDTGRKCNYHTEPLFKQTNLLKVNDMCKLNEIKCYY